LAALGQKTEPQPSSSKKGRIFEVFLKRRQKTYNTGIFEAKWPYVQTMAKTKDAAVQTDPEDFGAVRAKLQELREFMEGR
jgi:hypothetical protein